MYNPNYYRYNPNFNNSTPFNVARNTSEVFVNPKKGMDMKRMIANTEKGIDTISSIIPLCQKVTPLISGGKDLMKNLKSQFIKKNNSKPKVEKVEAELVDPPQKKKVNKEENIKKEQIKPNKPFF